MEKGKNCWKNAYASKNGKVLDGAKEIQHRDNARANVYYSKMETVQIGENWIILHFVWFGVWLMDFWLHCGIIDGASKHQAMRNGNKNN